MRKKERKVMKTQAEINSKKDPMNKNNNRKSHRRKSLPLLLPLRKEVLESSLLREGDLPEYLFIV